MGGKRSVNKPAKANKNIRMAKDLNSHPAKRVLEQLNTSSIVALVLGIVVAVMSIGNRHVGSYRL